MSRRPLVLALAFVLAPAAAHAEDLLQTYELARAGDPQFSAAESSRLATREGSVQARAAMLPQLNGQATYNRSRSDSEGSQAFGSAIVPSSGSNDNTTRQYGVDLSQMVYDHANFTRLRSANALARRATSRSNPPATRWSRAPRRRTSTCWCSWKRWPRPKPPRTR